VTDDEIRAAIASWPDPTPEQLDRLAVLLRPPRQEDTAA
jgi:hypothetical protein